MGMLPRVGVRECFWLDDPESLNDVMELLNPLVRKLESILTGEAGLKPFDFSPSTDT